MSEYNLLKLISDSGDMYVFDALTNNIFSVENTEDFDNVFISDFGHDHDLRANVLDHEDIYDEVKRCAKTLVIEVTEACDLRCSYCVYDERFDTDRSHGSRTISEDTAFKAVEEFYSRTNKEDGYIVFYGGEPLLAFNKIRKIVEFANNLSKFRLKFSFTTNGVALSDDKFEFLIKNNFMITVSIDGDRETHDRHRIAKTSEGTFDKIMENLNALREYNEQFFKDRVCINCVISDVADIESVSNYFDGEDFQKNSLRFSSEIQNSTKIDDHILSSITSKAPLGKVESTFLNSILKKIEFRKTDENAHKGRKICVPFSNRTYIRTDGSTQFCERIGNYKKEQYSSEDFERLAASFHTEFKAFISESCSKCFAYNFCEMCPASFINKDNLDSKLANEKCETFRKSVKQGLYIYINNMESEQGPDV
ncbi:MAG: radical SAM protein [Pelagibacterales bacterium]|nr:radical SAM protein [Pelagibacterales bacterium]